MDDNRKEVRRENKQVRSLKRLRTLKSKGKTGTNRYKKLREKVYNPFPDKSPLKKNGDPSPGKYGITKQSLKAFNKRSDAAKKKEASKLISKNPSPITTNKPINPKEMAMKNYKYPASGAIEMTSNPIEWFIGGGGVKAATKIGKAGFDLAKGLVRNQIKKPSTIKKGYKYAKATVKRAVTDLSGDKLGF